MKFGMLKQFVLTLSILLLSNAAFAWTMTGKIDSLWNGFYYGDNMSFYLEPGWTWAGVSGECGHQVDTNQPVLVGFTLGQYTVAGNSEAKNMAFMSRSVAIASMAFATNKTVTIYGAGSDCLAAVKSIQVFKN